MDKNNRKNERGNSGEAARRKVDLRDKEVPSPEARAGFIFKFLKEKLPELTDWDLICFCAEYLGSQISVHEWLEKEAVIAIARRVNFAHYIFDEHPKSGIKDESHEGRIEGPIKSRLKSYSRKEGKI